MPRGGQAAHHYPLVYRKTQIFLCYLQSQGLSTDATQLTTTHLRPFLVHPRENVKADENNPMKPARKRSLFPKTIQGYARSLKAFFSWLAGEGYITNNQAKLLEISSAPIDYFRNLAPLRAPIWTLTDLYLSLSCGTVCCPMVAVRPVPSLKNTSH